ncbi:MAG: CvpA family protein [Chloroflexi bacterium]|nr:CvpA family protein [Chloroflexota bacterium]MCY4106574.1 CvpA family protein [Chloroflexota bacterium]
MIDLRILILLAVFVFVYIGSRRGFSLELISSAGILLAMFALHQFDALIRNELLSGGSAGLHLLVQVLLFTGIVSAAYHTRAVIGSRLWARVTGERLNQRSQFQEGILGGLIGAVNGYLISGSVWYYIHMNDYPLWAEGAINVNPEWTQWLPHYLLVGGPTGSGDVFTLMVVGAFLIVLIVI